MATAVKAIRNCFYKGRLYEKDAVCNFQIDDKDPAIKHFEVKGAVAKPAASTGK